MTKREKGSRAVEKMLAHGMSVADVNEILQELPSCQFAIGAFYRLLDEQAGMDGKAKEAGK